MTPSSLLLTALFACSPKGGPVTPLPVGQELAPAAAIFERYLRASTLDNPEIMRSIQSNHMVMRLEIPAMGMNARAEMWWVAPNQMLMETQLDGLGTITQGYDGERGWMYDPTLGPRLLEGDELAQVKFQSEPYGDLDFDTRYSVLETVQQTDLFGETAWELKAVPRDWPVEIRYFFSTESGLLIASEQEVASPMGKIRATTRFSDYREAGGMLSPYLMEQKVMGMSQVMTVELVEYNLAVLPTIAVPPELAQ